MPLTLPPTPRRVLLLILILAGVYALPRLVTLRGIDRAHEFTNGDQVMHLVNLVLRTRAWKPGVLRDSALLQDDSDAFQPRQSTRWPPGVYAVASILAATFGPTSIWTTQLTNLLFLIILTLGVVLLGRPILGLSGGGWAAALVLLTPPVVASSWYFNLDLGLAAMVVMGLHLLLRTRGFSVWPATLSFAAWSVLGVLVKATYPLYLAAPCLVAVIQGLRLPGQRRQVAWRVAVTAAVSLALLLLLLPEDLQTLWREFSLHLTGAGREDAAHPRLIRPLTLEWLISVPLMAIRGYPWPLLLPILPGIILAHHPRARIPGRSSLLAFCWGTVVMLTLLTHRMERYLLPLYPLLSLLAVWGIQQLFHRQRRWVLSGLVIMHVAMLWVVQQRPTPWIPDPEAAELRAWMHDQRMPTPDQLERLRRLKHSSTKDYRQLEAAMGDALDASRARGPLCVAVRLAPELFRVNRSLKMEFYLLAAQLERSRLLPYKAHLYLMRWPMQGLELPLYRRCPTLLVVHDPELKVKLPGDPREVIARKDVQVPSTEWRLRLRVTLLERRQGPGTGAPISRPKVHHPPPS